MTRSSATRSRIGGGSTSQTASRLLLAVDRFGEDVASQCPIESAVKVLQSLSLLQKIDFWLRNPDYLADELLTEVEAERQPPTVLDLVAAMVGGKAPSLHRYPMAKYLYGAYERPDNALALLSSLKLIKPLRAHELSSSARRDYYLLVKGREAAAAMRAEVPVLGWYDRQADAIALLPEARLGSAARRRQYDQPEYAATRHGEIIPAITGRVRERARRVAEKFSYHLALMTNDTSEVDG